MAGVLYLIYHTGAYWISVLCLGLTLLYFLTSMFNLRFLQFLTVVLFAGFVWYAYSQVVAIITSFSPASYLELYYLVFLLSSGVKLFLEVVA